MLCGWGRDGGVVSGECCVGGAGMGEWGVVSAVWVGQGWGSGE